MSFKIQLFCHSRRQFSAPDCMLLQAKEKKKKAEVISFNCPAVDIYKAVPALRIVLPQTSYLLTKLSPADFYIWPAVQRKNVNYLQLILSQKFYGKSTFSNKYIPISLGFKHSTSDVISGLSLEAQLATPGQWGQCAKQQQASGRAMLRVGSSRIMWNRYPLHSQGSSFWVKGRVSSFCVLWKVGPMCWENYREKWREIKWREIFVFRVIKTQLIRSFN